VEVTLNESVIALTTQTTSIKYPEQKGVYATANTLATLGLKLVGAYFDIDAPDISASFTRDATSDNALGVISSLSNAFSTDGAYLGFDTASAVGIGQQLIDIQQAHVAINTAYGRELAAEAAQSTLVNNITFTLSQSAFAMGAENVSGYGSSTNPTWFQAAWDAPGVPGSSEDSVFTSPGGAHLNNTVLGFGQELQYRWYGTIATDSVTFDNSPAAHAAATANVITKSCVTLGGVLPLETSDATAVYINGVCYAVWNGSAWVDDAGTAYVRNGVTMTPSVDPIHMSGPSHGLIGPGIPTLPDYSSWL
jgi:hypothetical protein